VAALLAGLGLALGQVVALPPALGALQPLYFHLLMAGWVTQLIFGVVAWMFPQYSSEQPRGNERLAGPVRRRAGRARRRVAGRPAICAPGMAARQAAGRLNGPCLEVQEVTRSPGCQQRHPTLA